MKRTAALVWTTLLGLGLGGQLHAQTWAGQTVSGQSDIYKAGGNVTSADGLVPPGFSLTSGTGRILTFQSVTGSWQCFGGSIAVGPDGNPNCAGNGTNLNSSGDIAGIQMLPQMPLVGLFLGSSLPSSAPSGLTFNTAASLDFTSLSPLLGQVFFIGDGRTSTSLFQQFVVPDGATTLYLGVADGFNFTGNPGFYADNSGSMTASFTVAPPNPNAVPEPITLTLLGTGLASVAAARRRRKIGSAA